MIFKISKMETKISSYQQIESFKKEETLTGISKEIPVKFNTGFISSLYAKLAGRISKIKIRKIFSSKALTSDEWYIE